MKGVRILSQAMRQIAGSPGMALRVSALPLALLVGLVLLLAGASAGVAAGPAEEAAEPTLAVFIPVVVAFSVLAWALVSWIAVRWHRYVLLEEGSGWVPPWDAGLVGRYMLRVFVIGLIVALGALLAITVPLALAATDAGILLLLVPLVIQVAAVWVTLRLSVSLPAVALGERMSLGAAWASTRPAAGAIAILGVLLLALGIAASLLAAALGAVSPMLATVASLAGNWTVSLLSVGVLTVLYGHLVEGRELG